MKVIEVTFLNENKEGQTVFKREIKTTVKELDKSKVFGTVLTDFFRLIDLQSKKAIKLFDLSKPFDIIVKCENMIIDTTKISSELKTKFKLNKSAKRKKAFAQIVFAVLDYATTKTKITTFEKVVNNLENEIVSELIQQN